MGTAIPRTEVHEIKKKGWVLLYGRRKVGKTFLIRNFVDYTHYFFVERDGPILMESDSSFRSIDYESFKTLIYELLKNENNTVVGYPLLLSTSFTIWIQNTVYPS